MKKKILFIYGLSLLFFSGCSHIDPRQVAIDIPSGTPEIKKTALKEALHKLGKMAEIYGVETKIMLDKISDNTGTSVHTKAELPYDVTEMTASSLNSIGNNIAYVPYRPDIISNLKALGYNNFENKFIPSAIVTGGITEFDRGLETREASADFGYDTDELGDDLPLGLEYSQGKKSSAARITIDYNLIDMATMSGISGVQTTNTMLVHKGIGKKEIGVTLLGPSFGMKGDVKKVEGRHAALRLLIQASMVQLVGKYLDLPYWRLLPGSSPDPVVESYVSRGWHYQMNQVMRIRKVQELLFLHGYEAVQETGKPDPATEKAIADFSQKMGCSQKIDFELYTTLYYNVPLDNDALQRRYSLILKKHQEKLKAQQEQARLQAQQEQIQQQTESAMKQQVEEMSHPKELQETEN
jgi:hypothetical protein